VDAGFESRVSLWAGDSGRARLDELLSPVSGACGVWRYKQSGVGRENHKMMLEHYQQTKNQLVSYSPSALGFSRAGRAVCAPGVRGPGLKPRKMATIGRRVKALR